MLIFSLDVKISVNSFYARSVIAASADLASSEFIDAFEGPLEISSDNMPSDLTGLTRQGGLCKVIFGHFAQLLSINERFPIHWGRGGLRRSVAQIRRDPRHEGCYNGSFL
jgi:hypothetical protein